MHFLGTAQQVLINLLYTPVRKLIKVVFNGFRYP